MEQVRNSTTVDRPILFTTEEAAEFLSVKVSWLHKYRSTLSGGPPYIKMGGRVVYRQEDLLQYLKDSTVWHGVKG